jgi:hypothetical protein
MVWNIIVNFIHILYIISIYEYKLNETTDNKCYIPLLSGKCFAAPAERHLQCRSEYR